MSIRFDAQLQVTRSIEEVFAFIDDFSNTPKWNSRCVSVAQTSSEPRAVGSTLRYQYREPGRQGEMQGQVTAYAKPTALSMRFTDANLDAQVIFSLSASAPRTTPGTTITHAIEITPKSLLMKLMTPLMRLAARKQVQQEILALKSLLA